eukprot:jgi/Psemu1/37535/gm1.37535_g
MMKFSKIKIPGVGILSLLVASRCAVLSGANDPFLKEILTGRCYEQQQPSCNTVVGSIMNVLESHTESQVTEDLFKDAYVDKADFSSPKNAAMVWLKAYNPSTDVLAHAFSNGGKHWTTPETTPGGALLAGLSICARSVYNSNDDCSNESSNAYWKFWRSAYAAFAESVEGRLEIVLEDEHVDENFLQNSVLSHLDANAKALSFLKTTAGIRDAECGGPDLAELVLCESQSESESGGACGTYKAGMGMGTEGTGSTTTAAQSSATATATTTTTTTTGLDSSTSLRTGVPVPAQAVSTSTSTSTPIEKEEKSSGSGVGSVFVWLLLAIGGYLYYKRFWKHGNGSSMDCSGYDRFDCIKGDLVVPKSSNGSNVSNVSNNGLYYSDSTGVHSASNGSGATGSSGSGSSGNYSAFVGNSNGSSYGTSQ